MNQQAIDHETAFIRSFILSQRRERYLAKLASPKHRSTFLERLNHRLHKDLDERYVVGEVERVSVPNSVKWCYCIAYKKEYDGRFIRATEVADALAFAEFGIIVSLIPGRLTYY